MPVGGGQFNFMAKFCGCKDANPLKNLGAVFAKHPFVNLVGWRPVRIHDSLSDATKYGAVVSNGVVAEVTKWYVENGKGSVTGVAKTIALASLDSAFFTMMGTGGRVRRTSGRLTFDPNTPRALTLPTERYPCMMIGAVDQLLSTCRPFKKPIPYHLCGAMAYWGPFQRLVPSIPAIWLGKPSPLSDPFMVNRHSEVIELVTHDRQMLLDGEIINWPIVEHSMKERTFTISRGPAVTLLKM